MNRTMRGVILSVCSSAAIWGQAPAFEVASVKVSQFSNMDMEGNRKSNLNVTPDSLTLRNFSLHSCVQWAWNVKDFQVTGPDWIDSQRYDINAKAGHAVKEEELRRMLQTLLADRFKLQSHRETKELPVFVLTVAKDGLKMKQSIGEGDSSFQPVKGAGKLAISVGHTTMAQFVDLLRSPLQKPVVDETGLKGGYDFSLDLGKYLTLDSPQALHHEGEGARSGMDAATIENALVMALREELGLQLTPKKTAIDRIVIDQAEKVPSEN